MIAFVRVNAFKYLLHGEWVRDISFTDMKVFIGHTLLQPRLLGHKRCVPSHHSENLSIQGKKMFAQVRARLPASPGHKRAFHVLEWPDQ